MLSATGASLGESSTRLYLNALFEDLPSGQYIAVLAAGLRMAGYAESTIESAERRIASVSTIRNIKHNVYIGVNPTPEVVVRESKTGRQRVAPVRQSKAITISRAFYADIDFGKPDQSKSMKDPVEFAGVIKAAIGANKLLVPTMVVNSGVGLHLYWLLDKWAPITWWHPMAAALQARFREIGLRVDPITSDAARILRPPGTWHNKGPSPSGEPVDNSAARPVLLSRLDSNRYTRADFERLLGVQTPMRPALALISTRPKDLDPDNIDITRNLVEGLPASAPAYIDPPDDQQLHEYSYKLDTKTPPAPWPIVVKECKVLGGVLERQGAGDSEPLWSTVLYALAHYGEEARSIAHDASRGHVGYEQAKTDSKFDYKLRVVETTDAGWPTCDTFSTLSPDCALCRHRGKIKSPLALYKRTTDLPRGYFRRSADGHTQIWRIIDDVEAEFGSEQKSVMVLPCDVVDARVEMTDDGPALAAQVILANAPAERLVLPAVAINTWREGAMKILGRAGIVLSKRTMAAAQEFFVSFLNLLQSTTAPVAQPEAFGWMATKPAVGGSDMSFAVAGTAYTGFASTPVGLVPKTLQDMYSAVGEHQPWYEAARMMLQQGRPDIQAMIASSFAAPLVHFSGHKGLIISAYGESGRQKSAAVKVAASVWGHPTLSVLSGASTANSVLHRMGVLRNLPILWDEVRIQDVEERFPEIVFQFTQGVEKSRLTSDIQARRQGTWASMMLIASNFSVQTLVAEASNNHAAAANRIFEFEVSKLSQDKVISATDAETTLLKLNDHHGVVGRVYAAFLAQRSRQITTELRACAKLFEVKLSTTPEERFWVASAACLLLGATYAQKANIAQFDLSSLFDFLCRTLDTQRLSKEELAPTDDPVQFITEVMFRYIQFCKQHNRLLVTDHIAGGRIGKLSFPEVRMTEQARGQLRAPIMHIGLDDRIVRFLPSDFRAWLRNMRIPDRKVFEALALHGRMTKGMHTWCAKTAWSGPAVRYCQLDLFGTPMGDRFFESQAQDNTNSQDITNNQDNDPNKETKE